MWESPTYTLSDVARLFGEPQHRLIHLCEKGVVQPDHQDAEGRGSSRLFSARNVLEFAIALRLRAMNQLIAHTRAVVHVLRRFEHEVQRQTPGFALPDGLRGAGAPDLRVILSDGPEMYFFLRLPGRPAKVFGPVPLSGSVPRKMQPREAKADGKGFGGPEGSRFARLEMSITRIAQDLRI